MTIHLNDIGTVFEVTLKDETGAVLDVSSATVKQIVFQKPDKSLLTKTATFSSTGSDGKIRYVSQAGDLDQPKSWQIQAKVTMPSGSWSSDIGTFTVDKNL
jgi:hypothetical protein